MKSFALKGTEGSVILAVAKSYAYSHRVRHSRTFDSHPQLAVPTSCSEADLRYGRTARQSGTTA